MPADLVWSRAERATFARQKIVSLITWIRSRLRYAVWDPSGYVFADPCEESDRIKVSGDVSGHPHELIQTIIFRFERGMNDALNAEISLGTVSSINDAVQWLGYTYLFVRIKKNPMAYGVTFLIIHSFQYLIQSCSGVPWGDIADDPGLGAKRSQLAVNAVNRLITARMVNWNKSTGALQTTDLGRIAAKYYIRLASIEIFNQKFRPRMSEADVLTMLSHSTEVEPFHPLVSAGSLTPPCV